MLMNIFKLYLITINALGFLLMIVDKYKAQKGLWRIRESTLMGVAAIGGSIGSLCGMYAVRHKTKHLKFTLGIPAILVVQIILLCYFLG